YMILCQALTRGGGWSMSVFLTPEKKPFFARMYFSPQVFAGLLDRIDALWQENRTDFWNLLIQSPSSLFCILTEVRTWIQKVPLDRFVRKAD
ncbi:MAG: thioredoxin domain-containing protein, partial [Oscillospiraceae bacterium]|nr:thioredoxin domain-containing protein [Oscillospiraceae bacterium]